MALLEEIVTGWAGPTLLGVGAILAAPLLLPVVGAVAIPIAKVIVQSGLWVAESVQGLMAEGGEQLNDLIVEAKAEYHAGTATTAK